MLSLYPQMMSTAMGISLVESKKMVEDMLVRVIEESKEEGTYYLPQNLGDMIFSNFEDENLVVRDIIKAIKENLPKKYKEGVKDEDIRWWWNLNDVERRMLLINDDIVRLALFKKGKNDGLSGKESMDVVRKFYPMYGDPEDTTHAEGDNRPLPYELKDRVNIYGEKRSLNKDQIKKDIESSSSFNALVRREIKAGNL